MPLKLTAQNQALAFALKIAGRFFASDAVLGCFARRLDPAVLPGAQAIVRPFKNWLGHPAKFPLGFRLGASESLARWLRYPLQNRLLHVHAVCRGMDEALRRLGFTGGKVLEPAAGTCAFWAAESPDWSCDGSAGEIDHVSGLILSQLPPRSQSANRRPGGNHPDRRHVRSRSRKRFLRRQSNQLPDTPWSLQPFLQPPSENANSPGIRNNSRVRED